jgi:hypothetical protein
MSFSDFYHHKAKQCDDLAAAASDSHERARYQDEAALWRGIAKDIARQDRDEGGPP